jgi:hypothetical protein
LEPNDTLNAWEYWLGDGAQQYRRHKETGCTQVRAGTGLQRRWDVVREGIADPAQIAPAIGQSLVDGQ